MGATYRRLISITPSLCGSNPSTNFPLFVHFSDTTIKSVANGGHVQSGSGFDITFYATPYQTPASFLNYEFENYSATSGILDAWVQIPTLGVTSATATNIWMFYGDSTISSAPNTATSTWDSTYGAVYHLSLNGSLSVNDSTINASNLTNNNAVTEGAGVGGNAGCGVFASASSQNLSLTPNTAAQSPTVAATAEAWFKTSTTAAQTIMRNGNFGYRLNLNGSPIPLGQFFINNNAASPNLNDSRATVSDGLWHYVAVTYSPGLEVLYKDGTTQGYPNALSNAVTGPITYSNINFHIGCDSGVSVFMNGSIDEVRISNVARSTDYITATYNNLSNVATFITVGGEKTVAPGAASNVETDGDNQFYQRGGGIKTSLYSYVLGG